MSLESMICIDIIRETCNMVHKIISKEGLTKLGDPVEIVHIHQRCNQYSTSNIKTI